MSISDKTFDKLAQINHIMAGALLIFARIALYNADGLWFVAAIGVCLAALKEFVYDKTQEPPEIRGSDFRDFAFYVLGIGGAMGLYYLLHWSGE